MFRIFINNKHLLLTGMLLSCPPILGEVSVHKRLHVTGTLSDREAATLGRALGLHDTVADREVVQISPDLLIFIEAVVSGAATGSGTPIYRYSGSVSIQLQETQCLNSQIVLKLQWKWAAELYERLVGLQPVKTEEDGRTLFVKKLVLPNLSITCSYEPHVFMEHYCEVSVDT